MSGIYQEIQKRFGESVENYIMASRCAQGLTDLSTCTSEEKENILTNWALFEVDVVAKRNVRRSRYKVDGDGKRVRRTRTLGDKSQASGQTQEEQDTESVKAAERANRRESLRQLFRGRASSSPPPRKTAPDSALPDEYEHAIRHSVLATSQGNDTEDEMIERALRASMTELRNATAAGEEEERAYDLAVKASIREAERVIEEKKREQDERSTVGQDKKSNVHQPEPQPPPYSVDEADQKQQRRPPPLPPRSPMPTPTDHDIELQNALNESQRSYDDNLRREQREKEEMDIIMEYVKRQSLAEAEQQRRQQEQREQQREEA